MKLIEHFQSELISFSVVGLVPDGLVNYKEAISLGMHINSKSSQARSARLIATVKNEEGVRLFSSAFHLIDSPQPCFGVKLVIPSHTFMNGKYSVCLTIGIPGQQRVATDLLVACFRVEDSFNGSFYPDLKWPGLVQPACTWSYD